MQAAQPGTSNGTQTDDAPAAKSQPMTHSAAGLDPRKKRGRFRFRLRGGREKSAFITSQGH